MSDDEDEATVSLNPRPNCTSSNVLTRYFAGVTRLIHAINRYTGVYDLVPFLVAENVPNNVLRTLPTNVSNYHVKSQIINGRLFILELSIGRAHGNGVANIIEQIGVWISGHSDDNFLSSTTNSDYPNDNNNAAPDIVVAAGPLYRAGNNDTKIVIIELEVSNRSIPSMRRDYGPYFNNPALHSMLGIKLLGTVTCPCKRAAAVLWTRDNNGPIEASVALDFGFLPMSPVSKQYFSEVAQANQLPPVAEDSWQRFHPFPAAVPIPGRRATDFEMATLGRYFLLPQNRALLYPAGAPTVTIDSDVFTTRLVPLGGVPLSAADLTHLRIDLGVMLRKICGVAVNVINNILAAPAGNV